jgi:hypothetical protein
MFEPVNTLEKLDQAVCRLVNRETLLSDEPPRPKFAHRPQYGMAIVPMTLLVLYSVDRFTGRDENVSHGGSRNQRLGRLFLPAPSCGNPNIDRRFLPPVR